MESVVHLDADPSGTTHTVKVTHDTDEQQVKLGRSLIPTGAPMKFVSREQVALRFNAEAQLVVESIGGNSSAIQRSGREDWELLPKGKSTELVDGDKLALDKALRAGTVFRIRLSRGSVSAALPAGSISIPLLPAVASVAGNTPLSPAEHGLLRRSHQQAMAEPTEGPPSKKARSCSQPLTATSSMDRVAAPELTPEHAAAAESSTAVSVSEAVAPMAANQPPSTAAAVAEASTSVPLARSQAVAPMAANQPPSTAAVEVQGRATSAVYPPAAQACRYDGKCYRRDCAHWMYYAHPCELAKEYCAALVNAGSCDDRSASHVKRFSHGPLPSALHAAEEQMPPFVKELRAVAISLRRQRVGLCLVVGEMGAGKSTLLRELARTDVVQPHPRLPWAEDCSIISTIARECGGNVQDAIDRLVAVGLSSVPGWLKAYGALSNGMQERAALARAMRSRLALDDFGATVDVHTRQLLAVGVSRLARKASLHSVVLAAVDADLGRWLQPDLIIALSSKEPPHLVLNPAATPERPVLSIKYVGDAYDDTCTPALDDVVECTSDSGVRRRSRLVSATRSSGDTTTAAGSARQASSTVTVDAYAVEACQAYGLNASDVDTRRASVSDFCVPNELVANHTKWRVAALVGPSGSGKCVPAAERSNM